MDQSHAYNTACMELSYIDKVNRRFSNVDLFRGMAKFARQPMELLSVVRSREAVASRRLYFYIVSIPINW